MRRHRLAQFAKRRAACRICAFLDFKRNRPTARSETRVSCATAVAGIAFGRDSFRIGTSAASHIEPATRSQCAHACETGGFAARIRAPARALAHKPPREFRRGNARAAAKNQRIRTREAADSIGTVHTARAFAGREQTRHTARAMLVNRDAAVRSVRIRSDTRRGARRNAAFPLEPSGKRAHEFRRAITHVARDFHALIAARLHGEIERRTGSLARKRPMLAASLKNIARDRLARRVPGTREPKRLLVEHDVAPRRHEPRHDLHEFQIHQASAAAHGNRLNRRGIARSRKAALIKPGHAASRKHDCPARHRAKAFGRTVEEQRAVRTSTIHGNVEQLAPVEANNSPFAKSPAETALHRSTFKTTPHTQRMVEAGNVLRLIGIRRSLQRNAHRFKRGDSLGNTPHERVDERRIGSAAADVQNRLGHIVDIGRVARSDKPQSPRTWIEARAGKDARRAREAHRGASARRLDRRAASGNAAANDDHVKR